jgi:hypothetical protein
MRVRVEHQGQIVPRGTVFGEREGRGAVCCKCVRFLWVGFADYLWLLCLVAANGNSGFGEVVARAFVKPTLAAKARQG